MLAAGVKPVFGSRGLSFFSGKIHVIQGFLRPQNALERKLAFGRMIDVEGCHVDVIASREILVIKNGLEFLGILGALPTDVIGEDGFIMNVIGDGELELMRVNGRCRIRVARERFDILKMILNRLRIRETKIVIGWRSRVREDKQDGGG